MFDHGLICAGGQAGIPLPYRGQAPPVLPSEEEIAAISEPLCIQALNRSRMTRGQMTAEGPIPHAGLGLPAYVQFTSPIRRYHDMIAHWQVKVRMYLLHRIEASFISIFPS